MTVTLHAPDEAAMLELGRGLGGAARGVSGLVVYLEGELGAGKTTLSRGMLAGMGHVGRVRSPTYTLLEPYDLPGGVRLAHLDLYRLADPEELEFLGVRELSGTGHWLLIEWPEKGAGHLPPADLEIRIGFPDAGGRSIKIMPCTDVARRWLAVNVGGLLE